MTTEDRMDYSKEVRDALTDGKPLVALESTIMTHGMPFPENLETALSVESIIREESVVPATIAILKGRIKIGLEHKELKELVEDSEAIKVSRRDLASALVRQQNGGTTVSGTMICAHKAGIRVFVTGGIGGVHRDFEQTLDVSADLEELSRTPVAVVCAGVKSILDIPRTLEYLETKGVPVIGFGCDEFPAFYTPFSGIKAPLRMNLPEETARCMKTHWDLGLGGGLLIANPLFEEKALDPDLLQQVVEESLKSAEDQKISGKDITPFVLEQIVQKTGGASLDANIALIQNNARVGAGIARAYQNL
ncbi:MAG: pseudouridine-5'-phosphate glycosidase [SAR324 cluster bacterium]|nr:pseudouridine-5'-phosphate glycosidase [SAR324 cluster bacterium]